nr:MAG TPA: Protein of unknown function (DUF2612) [Caudoviricetes sp.]
MFREKALDVLQQQYGYTNISDLMMRKAAVWDKHIGNVSNRFLSEILDFNTCVPSALDYYWGKLLKVSRTFTDQNGKQFTLTDDQFREIIKIRAFSTRWDGTVTTLNEFLGNLFADRGTAYMVDRQDMTVQIYVFRFKLEEWEKHLFLNKDILPRCAGVGTAVYEITSDTLLGFEGTEFQTFGHGTMWLGKTTYTGGTK